MNIFAGDELYWLVSMILKGESPHLERSKTREISQNNIIHIHSCIDICSHTHCSTVTQSSGDNSGKLFRVRL